MENQSGTIWYLYIVETKFGHWYTGITTDINKRIGSHELGKGAKNLKGKGPLKLVFSCPAGNKSLASKLEWQIKKFLAINDWKIGLSAEPGITGLEKVVFIFEPEFFSISK